MKRHYQFGLIVLTLLTAHPLNGQGVFQNLGFENSSIPQDHPPGFVAIADALPGWNGYLGTNQQTEVFYNSVSLGAPNISLVGTNGVGGRSIEGGYSVILQGGTTELMPVSASIDQSATIPSNAQSLQWKAVLEPTSNFEVTIGGQALEMIVLFTGSTYTLFGADITTFAGQMHELRITSLSTAQRPFSSVNIDSLVFSPEPVPEPTTLALVLTWVAALLFHRWRRKRRS